MGIIDKIKAVWDKVFKTNDVKKIFGIETGRSSYMDTALSKYKDMRTGIPYWCTGRIKPTRFSNVICREIANLTLFNADIQITGNNELQKRFDSVMNTLQEKQEESCATCGMMVKSNGDDVEFLDPDYFLITDTNTDGDALAAIFFSYLKKNDKYYTKAEYHRFEDVGLERVYHISSKAFKSDNKDMIGTEITLDRVDEWKDIEPEVYVHGLEYPLFVYWRNPYANAIDKESPLTVPAFSECIEELRWLDIALNMMGDETEDSRHITYVPQTAIEYASKYSIELPRFIQGIEMGSNEDSIKEHVPTLLVGNKTILTYITELKAKAPVFGTTSLIETRANSYKDTTVKFGKTFSKAPTVLVSLSGGSQNTKSFGVQVLSTTTSSCVIRTVNGNNSSVSIIVNWCALA